MEAVARLNNVPTSPRKMRLVAGLIRGKSVSKALGLLKFEPNAGAARLEKLCYFSAKSVRHKTPNIPIFKSTI